jgi:hypothetical protein
MGGCHVAGGKCTRTSQNQILKKNEKIGAKSGHDITVESMDSATAKIGGENYYIKIYVTTNQTQKGEACEFDPETSYPFYAFIFTPKPTCQGPLLLSTPMEIT